MYLLMTVGTGIGSDPADAIDRLVRSCSFVIQSYKPDHIIYFCSPESKDLVSHIEEGCRELWGLTPPQSETCIIEDPNDFARCFEVIYGCACSFRSLRSSSMQVLEPDR